MWCIHPRSAFSFDTRKKKILSGTYIKWPEILRGLHIHKYIISRFTTKYYVHKKGWMVLVLCWGPDRWTLTPEIFHIGLI